MEKNFSFIQRLAYAMMIVIMSFIILKTSKQILYPLVLGMLFSYILMPMVIFLENKLKFPTVIASLFSVLLAIFIFSVLIFLFTKQIRIFLKDLPTLKIKVEENLNNLGIFIESKFKISFETQKNIVKSEIELLFSESDKFIQLIVNKAAKTIEGIIFIPIFTFFLLVFRKRWRNFILKLAKVKENKVALKILEQISNVTVRYIAGISTVVLILAFCHSTFLSIIGLKYAIAIGIITAVVSFLPYFGTLVSALIPLSFSLLLSDNPYAPMIILLYFWIITFIDHNILTPTITGGNVNLNPLATILGLIVATWIWGIPGMIVIVPVLAVMKIIFDNIDGFQHYGYLLGMEQHNLIEKIKNWLWKRKTHKAENEKK